MAHSIEHRVYGAQTTKVVHVIRDRDPLAVPITHRPHRASSHLALATETDSDGPPLKRCAREGSLGFASLSGCSADQRELQVIL